MSVLLTASHCKITDCKLELSDMYTTSLKIGWPCSNPVSVLLSFFKFSNLTPSHSFSFMPQKEVSAKYKLKYPSV